MNNLFNLESKVIIVTGGYGHLGTAMTNSLADFGATVIVAGRSKAKFDDKFSGTDRKIYFREYDIFDTGIIKNCFKEVYDEFGSIDVLINNAAAVKGNDPENMTDEEWSYSVEGVLGCVHRAVREIIPYMKKQGGGKIINVSSMYGLVSPDFKLYDGDECSAYINPAHYGAAKAGVLQLTRYYASWLGKNNITLNAVTPGPFPSAQIQQAQPVFIERLKNKTMLGKIGTPQDISGVCILLSSSASDFITGQNFVVDGGWTAQ